VTGDVFQTWHTHLWHTSILMASVYFTWLLYIGHQCFLLDMTSSFITSAYFTWHLHLWHQCFFRHDINIDDIRVFYNIIVFHTWQLYWRHQWFCFRHSINIYNIIVFQTWHLHLWHQCIFTSHLHSWYQCFSDMTSTLMTSNGDVMSEKHECHKCRCHV
jgi:hypothetical protein